MFEKDDEYVVIDGQVKIVDEQTGRIMEGRRYSDGLHQAIGAKEEKWKLPHRLLLITCRTTSGTDGCSRLQHCGDYHGVVTLMF